MHFVEHFFTVQDFWATCTCPEKQSLPYISLHWIYFWPFRIFKQLCPCPENFHCIEHTFYFQDFWATCACPEKQSVPWRFSLHWNIFYHSGRIFEQLALALKNSLCPEFNVFNIYLSPFRIFDKLALALKTESALKIFWPKRGYPHRPFASYAYDCYWMETSTIGSDFVIFIAFHCPQPFASPCRFVPGFMHLNIGLLRWKININPARSVYENRCDTVQKKWGLAGWALQIHNRRIKLEV